MSRKKLTRVAPAARVTAKPGRRSEFLTPTETADRLLIAPVTVRLWASKGLLPSVTTPGGHRRFRVKDVEAFIAKRRLLEEANPQAASRLLIIDDDPQFARYLSRVVSKHVPSVFVDIADSGFAAGIKCEALRPDVLTLDLHMPDMDGFDVCELIRAQFGRKRPRIVALTGFPTAESSRKILAAGADCCLGKTAPVETLLLELGLAVEARR